MPSVTTLINFTGDFGGPRTNISPVAAASLRIDNDFKSPYSDQYILQFEQQLTTDLGMQVNYVHKEGGDYGAWQDINGQYALVPYIDNVGADATGQTVTVYRLLSSPGRCNGGNWRLFRLLLLARPA